MCFFPNDCVLNRTVFARESPTGLTVTLAGWNWGKNEEITNSVTLWVTSSIRLSARSQ